MGTRYIDSNKVVDVIVTDLEHREDVPDDVIDELLGDISLIPCTDSKEALPKVIDIRFDNMGFVIAFDSGWKTRYTIGRLIEEQEHE